MNAHRQQQRQQQQRRRQQHAASPFSPYRDQLLVQILVCVCARLCVVSVRTLQPYTPPSLQSPPPGALHLRALLDNKYLFETSDAHPPLATHTHTISTPQGRAAHLTIIVQTTHNPDVALQTPWPELSASKSGEKRHNNDNTASSSVAEPKRHFRSDGSRELGVRVCVCWIATTCWNKKKRHQQQPQPESLIWFHLDRESGRRSWLSTTTSGDPGVPSFVPTPPRARARRQSPPSGRHGPPHAPITNAFPRDAPPPFR